VERASEHVTAKSHDASLMH